MTRRGTQTTHRPRGRPRLYDPEEALEAAHRQFWSKGFTGTSLDDLTKATRMNRPSLYRAFGDKEALYRRTLARVVDRLRAALTSLVVEEPDVAKGLRAFFAAALDLYFSMDPAPGCPLVCTATVEAPLLPEVKRDLEALITELDRVLSLRLRKAKRDGQIPEGIHPDAAAKIVQAVLHSAAIRARAGESKASLLRMAGTTVDLICGPSMRPAIRA